MREFLKMTCVVAIMIGSGVGALAWVANWPNNSTWIYRMAGPAVALVGLAGFLFVHFRSDKAPDFLRRRFRRPFDRNGLCFAFEPVIRDGFCFVRVVFQNSHERRCRAEVALRPAQVFGMIARGDFQGGAAEIDCPPGGLGIALIPLGIPAKYQGTRQAFQVGATVRFPHGKGRTLRTSTSAIALRTNADFTNVFHTLHLFLLVVGHHLSITQPAQVAFSLPRDVAESIPANQTAAATLWQLGDPADAGFEAIAQLSTD